MKHVRSVEVKRHRCNAEAESRHNERHRQREQLRKLAEVPFGIGWAWWLSAEQPGPATLWGGACVLAALVYSEAGSARPPAASTMPAPLPKDRAAS